MTSNYLSPGWLVAYAVGVAAWLGIYALTGWAVLPLLGLGLVGVVAFWRWIITERYSPRGMK